MRARLICRTGTLAGLEFELGHEGATVGRAAGNTIALPARPISGEHARIRFDEEAGAFVLEDLGSTNGTELDGVPVSGEERLGPLHVITFSREFDFVFRTFPEAAAPEEATPEPPVDDTAVDREIPTMPPTLRDGAAAPESEKDDGGTRVEEIPVVLPSALAQPEAKTSEAPVALCALKILQPKEHRRLYLLAAGEHLVGRSDDAQIWIDGPDLSRRHSRITVSVEGIQVEDLGSRNHTFVDEEQLTAPTVVSIGSKLRFASVQAELIDPDSVELRKGEGG